jgi:hypothetical protein
MEELGGSFQVDKMVTFVPSYEMQKFIFLLLIGLSKLLVTSYLPVPTILLTD